MITREILEAQLEIYRKNKVQAIEVLEQVKANASALIGAIDACENLLRILGELEKVQATKSQESSEAEVVEVKTK